MLARKFLVPLKTEFTELRKTGSWHDFPQFRVLIGPNTLKYRRFAVIVSKKVSPLSVKRHQIKRMFIDEIVALNNQCPAKNKDLVFLIKPQALNLTDDDLKKQLTSLLSQ